MRTAALRSLLLASTLVFGIAQAGAAPRSPADMVRDMEHLQDRIATGDTLAEAAHAKSIERTALAFAAAPRDTWRDKRNARALIIYLFSGGNAPSIEDTVPEDAVAEEYRKLYAGALAYGLGNDIAAREKLIPVDARSLPEEVGGHLALVQATLIGQDDRAKALRLLDLARLIAPGTLVEEAALRKEMSLIGATGDLDKFALLARRYRDAFPRSIYADNFRMMVATAAVELGGGDTDESAGRLGKLMAGLDRREQRRLYLLIARTAVLAGRTKMAALASSEAGRLAQGSRAEVARAMVYFGAATIVGDQYDLGLKALESVTPEELDARDRALRTSALALAAMIRDPGRAHGGQAPEAPTQIAAVGDSERALAASAALLKDLAK